MNSKALGTRINHARKQHGITSETLSVQCEVNAVYIRQIEGGTRTPSLPIFVKICNALNISPTYLLQTDLETNELQELNGLTDRCRGLSQKQLEKVNKIIETMFEQDDET